MAIMDIKPDEKSKNTISKPLNLGAGPGVASSWIPVKSGSTLTIHCLAIKQLLLDSNVDIEVSALGDVYFNIGAEIENKYDHLGANGMCFCAYRTEAGYIGHLYGDHVVSSEWAVTEAPSPDLTINEFLTNSGDIKAHFYFEPEGHVSFFLQLSIGYISSGYWIDIPSDVSKYFEISEPEA